MDISSLRERNTQNVLSVSELNGYIKRIFDLDRTLTAVSVKGEISNFVYHRTGHLYFSLKDSEGQIKAVMFRSSAQKLKFMPENGMKVVIHGAVSVFTRDGTYQLYANTMEPDGIGALYLAYEQLKNKLREEGLFDECYKKALPLFPERIGVITSPTGAAVRDIINVLGRRFPVASIYVYPSLVQGDGAASNLIKAIDYFEQTRLADVIIIGRGGGSIEDLWAFNNEALARKISDAVTPIISAVGHETDFTICDFVADMRAPTPSAAAEIAVPDIRETMLRIDSISEKMRSALLKVVDRKRERLNIVAQKNVLTRPLDLILEKRGFLSERTLTLLNSATEVIKEKRTDLLLKSEKLSALNPIAVILRGYSITEKQGKVVKSVKDIEIGDEIQVKISDGTVLARAEKIKKTKGGKK